jgi:hypothetical protein
MGLKDTMRCATVTALRPQRFGSVNVIRHGENVHIRSILLMAATLAAGACSRGTTAPRETEPGQSIDLDVGETVAVRNTSVQVRFFGANDSRCPSDVVCVTAGDAVIFLTLSGMSQERTDTLYLVRQPKNVVYGGFRFEATALQPYPKSSGTRPSPVLTLRVTAGS